MWTHSDLVRDLYWLSIRFSWIFPTAAEDGPSDTSVWSCIVRGLSGSIPARITCRLGSFGLFIDRGIVDCLGIAISLSWFFWYVWYWLRDERQVALRSQLVLPLPWVFSWWDFSTFEMELQDSLSPVNFVSWNLHVPDQTFWFNCSFLFR